jgi:YegS/Rv2252/BmrU family lipid kinase
VKTRFIVNPRSGRATRALPEVRAFAEKHGASVHLTERPRHARELAAEALRDGCTLVVAVGGDGTMNEVATALVGADATLGLVPCGSGDGLGRHLGMHGTIAHALGVVRSGVPRSIDTGLADGHAFFAVAGLGFEAEIARRFNRLQRRGFFRYLTTSAATLRQWKPDTLTLVHADRRETLRAFTLAIANTAQYGNGARIAPDARIDDGLLDLVAVGPIGLFNAVPLVVRLFAGSLARSRHIVARRASHFVIERAAPGPIHTDGEIHEAGTRIEFSLRPASLRVLVPSPG